MPEKTEKNCETRSFQDFHTTRKNIIKLLSPLNRHSLRQLSRYNMSRNLQGRINSFSEKKSKGNKDSRLHCK